MTIVYWTQGVMGSSTERKGQTMAGFISDSSTVDSQQKTCSLVEPSTFRTTTSQNFQTSFHMQTEEYVQTTLQITSNSRQVDNTLLLSN